MEQWEALVEACPSPVDLRYFSKAIQTAGVALKGDLAHFEIEWILQTLLHKPVCLLEVVSCRRADDAWLKVIGDAFKLLADATDCHREEMEIHFQDVVERCVLGFDALTRQQALRCLSSVARVSATGATHASRHVASLEESTTAKGPLALLIGTICEHHPETVENDINRIWRIYLNLLDVSKNTPTITSSLLRGVLGLFRHFGCDLPTAELTTFYDKLAHHVAVPRCKEVCLEILAEHSHLFRERISRDVQLRALLWDSLQGSASSVAVRATTGAYKSICGCLEKEQLQRIAMTELIPQAQSHRTQVKYTALRLLTHLKTHCGVDVDVDGQLDAHALDFELRQGSVTADIAEAVAWCIESQLPSSETLLQTSMLFYTHLPANRRKHIVVHGIHNAQDTLRTTAIIFLISESIQSETSLETHLALWRDLFDPDGGKDTIVLDKSRHVFEDFMNYVVFVLEAFIEQGIEKPPEKLRILLQLAAQVLSSQARETYTNDHSLVLLPLLTELLKLHPDAVTMSVARCACAHVTDARAHVDELTEFYQVVRIDTCKDEALLCESCLALVEAATGVAASDVLVALQIIFSRSDVEPQVLSKALLKLENIINLDKDTLNCKIFFDILHHVQKIYNRKDLSGKDARILHRDVLMFLGKYGRAPDIDINNANNTVIVKLMDSLILNLTNPGEGTAYKINLQKLLHQALHHEDPGSLLVLLVILCANLSTKREATGQEALSLVLHALSRAHARGSNLDPRALQAAVLLCDSAACVRGMLRCISEEKSPGVRKMLSDALEALLVQDSEDALFSSVAEHAAVMMRSVQSTTRRAGLNISETVISSLKNYNSLTKTLLPELLVLVANTFEIDSETTFETGSKLFLEKIELFDDSYVEKLVKDLLQAVLVGNVHSQRNKSNVANMMAESEVRIYKVITKTILDFVKSVTDYRKEEKKKIWIVIFVILDQDNCDFEKSLYALALFKNIFGYASDMERDFLNQLFCMEIQMEKPYFCMEAVLIFLEEYADMLLVLYYQETLQFLCKYITELSPPCIQYLHGNIKSCLSVYTKGRTPVTLQASLETWCSRLPITEITNRIEKESFTTEHSAMVFSLKVMLQFLDITTLIDLSNVVKKWPRVLLKLFSNGHIASYLKSKMSYLTDILAVSVRFLKVTDVKQLFLGGLPAERVGIEFCRFFMHVFYGVLVKKPFVLLDVDMVKCCALLNDVVKFTIKKKCTDEQYDTVLELVDKLWPTYELQTTFTQKHSLLLDLNNFPRKLSPESNPLQWAVNNVIYSEASREDKAKLVGVLPGGHHYSAAYRSFASLLPTRLSEMRGGALCSLRAVLDALAATRDQVLLDIVITLASGDESKGWWDEAMEACMASVATSGDLALCRLAYSRCARAVSPAACRRVLLPLLRYSTSAFNEEFFSTVLDELLKPKEQKVASTHRSYHKSIVDHTRLFLVLQVACEKISQTSLESPSSVLYKEVVPTVSQSWYLIRIACRLCNNLRKKPLPEGADDKFKDDYRQFQCANYNCFAAAICRRRPDATFYENIFDAKAWDLLLDHNKEYTLWIRHQWNQRSTRQPVSIVVEGRGAPAHGSAGSARSRVFLRTLSESPLMYDLIEPIVDDQATTQDIHLPLSDLNAHECAGTLSALLRHVAATLPPAAWLPQLAYGLEHCRRNTRWLLAQVICNCKEELQPHASGLRAALLGVVASTALLVNGNRVLNGLHVDILETIVQWGDSAPSPSSTLDAVLTLLLSTGVQHKTRKAVHSTLVNVAVGLLGLYGGVVRVDEAAYEPYLTDNDTPKALLVHIPSALPTLLAWLESKQLYQLPKVAEVVGQALNSCADKQHYLIRFKKALDRVRQSNGAEFVRMLYYAQSGCKECCDEYNFRMATNLAQKLVGQDKNKCLHILSTFVSTSSSEYIQEMFEAVDLPELMAQETVEAFSLVKEGVRVVSEDVRMRLVMVAARYCDHSLVEVRGAAGSVMLAAFEDLFRSPEEPASKRPRPSSSALIATVLSKDVYSTAVMRAVAGGCVDSSDVVSGPLRAGVAHILSKDMGTRLVECFFLTVYLPTMSASSQGLSVCVFALLDLLLSDLRSQDRFQKLLLRDEPLVMRSASAGSSKLLTMSRTYQGTFRRATFTSNRNSSRIPDTNPNSPEIDVQISIEHILDTFMRFAKVVPQVSEVLCLELVQDVLPGLHLRSEMAEALAAILDKGVNELTPFVTAVCRVFVDELCKVDGIQNTMRRLVEVTRNTEGEGTIRLLSQEVRLRCEGPEQFVLGSDQDETLDVAMDEAQFSIEGLTSVFGSLSNWDSLTAQQRDRIHSRGLPPLWTGRDKFRELLDSYRGADGWFGKMAAACRGEGKEDAMRWLRETDRWPRAHFHNSAITEAVLMQQGGSSAGYFPCDMRPEHCLAEWAGRLMLRTAYQTISNPEPSQDRSMLSRSHELKWCEMANERQLGAAVLECVKRNTPELTLAGEALPWLCSKMRARRWEALRLSHTATLQRTLQTARTHLPRLVHVCPGSAAQAGQLILLLHKDLDSLSRENLQEVYDMLDSASTGGDLSTNKQTLHSICELAMSHYDELWDTDATSESQQSALVSEMTAVLARSSTLGQFDEDLLAMVLGRLDQLGGMLSEDVAERLLDQIHSNLPSIDDSTVDYILSLRGVLPPRSLSARPLRGACEAEAEAKYKRCLQLLCDPEHCLLQYCSELRNALKNSDEDQWEVIFSRMKKKLFENPYSGPDFLLLNRYKAKLYEISEYDLSPVWRARAEQSLKEIQRALSLRPPPAALRTPELCPALARIEDCPARLLGLPPRTAPLRVDPQLMVLQSIRRPVVFRAVLADGSRRRFLLKSGEPLRVDQAAQRVLGAARRRGGAHTTYKVTPLSEDCGLIEFLEDHETLRSLIGADVLDDAQASVSRPADHELLLSPAQATLGQHRQLCGLVPSHLLRGALGRRALCEQDRLFKMANFQDTLASATIITWILGVGDRHLENILYSVQDGRLCHIDWGAALSHGGAELPPARLTRNLLAICDVNVLEARLQQFLASLRESHRLLSAVIKISFKWMAERFNQKYGYMTSLLRGSALSSDVARATLGCSAGPVADAQLQLLERVLAPFQQKQHYTVQEQISCLLRHCTDPQILSVTRAHWEPWV